MNYIIFEFKLDSSTFFCDMSLLGSEPEGRTSTDFLTSAEQQRVKQITKDQQLNSKPDKPQTTQSFKNNPQEITHTTQKKKTLCGGRLCLLYPPVVCWTNQLQCHTPVCSISHTHLQHITHNQWQQNSILQEVNNMYKGNSKKFQENFSQILSFGK